MNSELDDFISEHRSEFDQVESFDMEASWQNIQEQSTKKKSGYTWLITLIGLIVLILTIYIVVKPSTKYNQDEAIAYLPESMTQSHEHLLTRISMHEKQLASLDIDVSEFEEILQEIRLLEEQKSEIIEDYNEIGNKEHYAKILLKHYERKARIIELLLYEINKKENDEQYKKI